MSLKLLATRPSHDITTYFISAWCKEVVDFAKSRKYEVFDLKKRKANRKEITSRLKKLKPDFVIFNGHGNEYVVAGHNDEALIEAGVNEAILKSKIIYALSCRSAANLGPASIKAGAIAYIGYSADFIFFHRKKTISRPLNDKVAKLFLYPSNLLTMSILKGNECKQACENSKKYINRNVHRLLASDASTESSLYARYLWWNMKNLKCLGDKKAKLL
ncbi:hypothetical protein KAJ89_02935 [Candidatus Parcubacteria bacterium]|nr:hypothetical protein [Candidatus Parcubacteria bacterium]